jgi:hypothetical protein
MSGKEGCFWDSLSDNTKLLIGIGALATLGWHLWYLSQPKCCCCCKCGCATRCSKTKSAPTKGEISKLLEGLEPGQVPDHDKFIAIFEAFGFEPKDCFKENLSFFKEDPDEMFELKEPEEDVEMGIYVAPYRFLEYAKHSEQEIYMVGHIQLRSFDS